MVIYYIGRQERTRLQKGAKLLLIKGSSLHNKNQAIPDWLDKRLRQAPDWLEKGPTKKGSSIRSHDSHVIKEL